MTGALFHGLYGCGRKTILQKLGENFDSKIVVNPVQTSLSKLDEQISANKRDNLLILIPEFELWLSFLNSSNQSQETPDLGQEKINPLVVRNIFDILEKYPKKYFILVSANSEISFINESEQLKLLFYWKVLIPMPRAEERLNFIENKLDIHGVNFEERNELKKITANLHGYSFKDIDKILKGALLKLEKYSTKKDEDYSALFCSKLMNEHLSYQPINMQIAAFSKVKPLNWKNIAGYDEVKRIFQNQIQNRLLLAIDPESERAKMLRDLKLNLPKGILLHGPPGCSKTMFVRALATECLLPLISVQSSKIFGRYVGDSERNMRNILLQAYASAPAILFLDEIDLLLPSRSSGETGASEHVLSELLMAMDGASEVTDEHHKRIIFIGATNRMQKLDSALTRAGRFDIVIEINEPDVKTRYEILLLELSQRLHNRQELTTTQEGRSWLYEFAETCLDQYTGAECTSIVQKSAEIAFKRFNSNGSENKQATQIERSDLEMAVKHQPARSLAMYQSQCLNQTITTPITFDRSSSNADSDLSSTLSTFHDNEKIVNLINVYGEQINRLNKIVGVILVCLVVNVFIFFLSPTYNNDRNVRNEL